MQTSQSTAGLALSLPCWFWAPVGAGPFTDILSGHPQISEGLDTWPRPRNWSRANQTGIQTWPFPRLLPYYCPARFSKFSLERQAAHPSKRSSGSPAGASPACSHVLVTLPTQQGCRSLSETDSGEEGKHPLGSTCVLGAHTCQLSSWLSKGSQQAKLGILTMTFSLVAQSRRLINPTR